MKIMIEVSGGTVCNVTATQECSVYIVDHDNLKCRDDQLPGVEIAKEAMQPDHITWEECDDITPFFDRYLNEALEEYK